MEQEKSFLSAPVAILIAGVLIAGAIIYMVGRGNVAPAPEVNEGDTESILKIGGRDVVLGEENAPVTIIEYGDFQCPFCGRYFSQTENKIRDAYVKTGKVKVVYRDLAFLGTESRAAALALECSKDQGKFWEFHDALYLAEIEDGEENNGNLTKELFTKIGNDLEMNSDDLIPCIENEKYADVVSETSGNGEKAIGRMTSPVVFVNGEKVIGAQPFEVFKSVIDAELAK